MQKHTAQSLENSEWIRIALSVIQSFMHLFYLFLLVPTLCFFFLVPGFSFFVSHPYLWKCIRAAGNSMCISHLHLCSLSHPLTHAHTVLVLSYNSLHYLAMRETMQTRPSAIRAESSLAYVS